MIIIRAQERSQVSTRTKIGLNRAVLPLHSGLLVRLARAFASTASLSARLLRSACRRSSFAARSLEIGDVLKVMVRTERRWGRREKVQEPHAPTLLGPERQLM
jgi:hypothetical protein